MYIPQVKCALWQAKHARRAFFLFGREGSLLFVKAEGFFCSAFWELADRSLGALSSSCFMVVSSSCSSPEEAEEGDERSPGSRAIFEHASLAPGYVSRVAVAVVKQSVEQATRQRTQLAVLSLGCRAGGGTCDPVDGTKWHRKEANEGSNWDVGWLSCVNRVEPRGDQVKCVSAVAGMRCEDAASDARRRGRCV